LEVRILKPEIGKVMTMAELKLLNKHWIAGFETAIKPIDRVLVSLRVHPHIITVAGLAISALAFNFFRLGWFFWGGVMVVFSGVCDVLDGRLARGTNRMSKFGALIDSTIDRYSEVIMFLGLAVFFRQTHVYIAYLIILAIAGSFMVSYTRARAEGLGIECRVGLMQRPERMTYLALGAFIGSAFLNLGWTKAGIYVVIASIWFIAIFANITVIQRVIYIRNQLKKSGG
jgi:CDP-diacylglycerol--glycerol-3-phosphate 3-phosphatidyltransferase